MAKSSRASPGASTAFFIAIMWRSRPDEPMSSRSSMVVAGSTTSACLAAAVQ
jgi:hypothetical protein